MFQFTEFTVVMKQKKDTEFIDLLNKIRTEDIDANVHHRPKLGFLNETADNYPRNAVHMFAENYPTLYNKRILDTLPKVN